MLFGRYQNKHLSHIYGSSAWLVCAICKYLTYRASESMCIRPRIKETNERRHFVIAFHENRRW